MLLRQDDGYLFSGEELIGEIRDIGDAALIVRACNAHDDLVAALNGLLDRLGPGGYYPAAGAPACELARAALLKAKGA